MDKPEDRNRVGSIPNVINTSDASTSTRSVQMVPSLKFSSFHLKPQPSQIDLYSIKDNIDEFLEMESEEAIANYPGTEYDEYVFSYEREGHNTTSILEATGYLIKGCLGASILTMHEAYSYGGLWTSLAAGVIVGLMTIYNMLKLIKSAQVMYVKLRIPKMSYPDLVEAAMATAPVKCFRKCSKCLRHFVSLYLFIGMCCACNIYQLIMAYAFRQILIEIAHHELDIRICAIIVSVPILAFSCIRSLKCLAPISFIIDVLLILCVISALYYSMREAVNITSRPAWKSLNGVYHFLGMYIYAIDGITLALPIENNMSRPVYFPAVAWAAMSLVVISCNVVGFIGYWGWGENCSSPLTNNMPSGKSVPIVLQFILVLIMPLSFSIHFWVPFGIAWKYIGARFRRHQYRHRWEILSRCIIVLIINTCCVAFPILHGMLSFVGLFFLSVITFLVPPVVEILVVLRYRNKLKKL